MAIYSAFLVCKLKHEKLKLVYIRAQIWMMKSTAHIVYLTAFDWMVRAISKQFIKESIIEYIADSIFRPWKFLNPSSSSSAVLSDSYLWKLVRIIWIAWIKSSHLIIPMYFDFLRKDPTTPTNMTPQITAYVNSIVLLSSLSVSASSI